MSNANNYLNDSLHEDREIKGLFCEEVLREWLQNLEQLIVERDSARAEAAANRGAPGFGKADASHLSLVKNSGRGT